MQVWRPHMTSGTSRLARLAAAAALSGGVGGSGGEGGAAALGPPMIVTYRLSGLDGEATEPVVKTLGGAGADQKVCPGCRATSLSSCVRSL
jgi:hypothetical protein